MTACASEIPGLELQALAAMARAGYECDGPGAVAVRRERGRLLALYLSARRLRRQGMSEGEIGRAVGRCNPEDEFVALVCDERLTTRVVYRARPFRRAYG